MMANNPNYNCPCKYEPKVKCFKEKECFYVTVLECLQTEILSLKAEIKELTRKRILIHDRISLKWRDSAFYNKKRYKTLLKWCEKRGIKPKNLAKIEKEMEDDKLSSSKESNSGTADTVRQQPQQPEQSSPDSTETVQPRETLPSDGIQN